MRNSQIVFYLAQNIISIKEVKNDQSNVLQIYCCVQGWERQKANNLANVQSEFGSMKLIDSKKPVNNLANVQSEFC